MMQFFAKVLPAKPTLFFDAERTNKSNTPFKILRICRFFLFFSSINRKPSKRSITHNWLSIR